jgi:hypothetical protein
MDKQTERLLKDQLLRNEKERLEGDLARLEAQRNEARAARGQAPVEPKSGSGHLLLWFALVVLVIVVGLMILA